MVVLSCAVCTKNGRALVSRQFVELSKARIEGLLAAFPKLMGSGKQHTFIETDTVRYVYQPLESLYVLLITNKNSNILEDLETLHLVAKLVPEYCHSLEEESVAKNAFELIFAFDEIIAMGTKERVTVQQVRHFTTMESHEEERARVEQQLKEAEAARLAKANARKLEKKQKEARDIGKSGGMSRGGYGGGGMGGSGGIGGGSSAGGYDNQPFVEQKKQKETAAPAASSKKGMVLGAKSKKTALAQVLKEERIVERDEEAESISAGDSHAPSAPTEPVTVTIDEQLVIRAEHDGGLQSMEIKGGLSVVVNDPNIARVRVGVQQGDNKQFQFKIHPNIDKAAFTNNSVIQLRGDKEGFPSSVMRWRLQTSDESMLPISVSCWPNVSKDQTSVAMEYELLQVPGGELHDVHILVPVPGNNVPVVSQIDGQYDWDGRGRNLSWRLPIVDKSNKTGNLEFTVAGADPKHFFPLQISFTSTRTYCDITVEDVSGENGPVRYSYTSALSVEQFEIM